MSQKPKKFLKQQLEKKNHEDILTKVNSKDIC